jgi:peptidoglycan/xylan/chitin deacetylase (PgdA/CDA1 family)
VEGQVGTFRFGWPVVISVAVAVAATTYAIGNVLGRATDSAMSAEPAPPSASTPSVPSTAPPDDGEDEAAAPVSAPIEPVAAVQPVTGPGRPPLPMEGSGPHGTRRTTGDEYVALTFDDGPDPQWTPEVLKLLREHRVKATFCVVGEMVEAFPELVREIAEDGHTLCNHSWNHDFGLGSRSRADIRKDLERTNAAIREAVPGARISYYRQPGGAWTERVVEVAAEFGMSSLHWAVDPQDWSQPGATEIAEVVSSGTDEGAIVLLHDGGGERHGTVRALTRFLPDLAGRHSLAALPPGIDPPRRHGLDLPLKPSQI